MRKLFGLKLDRMNAKSEKSLVNSHNNYSEVEEINGNYYVFVNKPKEHSDPLAELDDWMNNQKDWGDWRPLDKLEEQGVNIPEPDYLDTFETWTKKIFDARGGDVIARKGDK